MKKVLLVLVSLVLIASFVKADTNVSIGVQSNEDINIWANPNTPGTTNYFLDGVNYKQTVDSLYRNDMGMETVYRKLSEIFMEQDHIYRNQFTITNSEELDDYNMQKFRWVMDTYFVPRKEYNKLIDYTNSLEHRITVLEEVVGTDLILEKNKEMALENNLEEFYFRGKKYRRIGNDYVYIEINMMEQEKEQIDENATEVNATPTEDLLVEKWQELCGNGLKQFCAILEQRGYNTTIQ